MLAGGVTSPTVSSTLTVKSPNHPFEGMPKINIVTIGIPINILRFFSEIFFIFNLPFINF